MWGDDGYYVFGGFCQGEPVDGFSYIQDLFWLGVSFVWFKVRDVFESWQHVVASVRWGLRVVTKCFVLSGFNHFVRV